MRQSDPSCTYQYMKNVRFHPWRELRARQHIEVLWPQMKLEIEGRTDGLTWIEIARRLGQAERRCTLTHELVHIDLGHTCEQSEAIERKVRLETARRLIHIKLLGAALAYTLHLDDVALDIWVTRSVLDDRLSELTENEHLYLMRKTEHHRILGET